MLSGSSFWTLAVLGKPGRSIAPRHSPCLAALVFVHAMKPVLSAMVASRCLAVPHVARSSMRPPCERVFGEVGGEVGGATHPHRVADLVHVEPVEALEVGPQGVGRGLHHFHERQEFGLSASMSCWTNSPTFSKGMRPLSSRSAFFTFM